VIILEEAAHLKPQLFHNVIVPLLTVEHTAMLAITSPGDEQNYISVIQDLKDPDGGELFYNIKIGMMCEKCLKEGKEKCGHELKRLPNWKSESRHDIVRAVYGQNQEAMKREAEGLIVSNRVYLFGKKDVDALESREAYHFEYDVQLIEIGIDPSGGGANSDYTIVSKCVENGKDIVRFLHQRKHLSHARDEVAGSAIGEVVARLEQRSVHFVPGDEERGHLLERLHELVLQFGRLVLQHEPAEQLGIVQHVPCDDGLFVVSVAASVDFVRHRYEQIGHLGRRILARFGLGAGHYLLLLQFPAPEQSFARGGRAAAEKQHVFHRQVEHLGIAIDEYAPEPRHPCSSAAALCLSVLVCQIIGIDSTSSASKLFIFCAMTGQRGSQYLLFAEP